MSLKVDNYKLKTLNKLLVDLIEKLANRDEKLIEFIEDLDSHFRGDVKNPAKKPWSLGDHVQKDMSGLSEEQFNCLMDVLGYKIVYSKTFQSLRIKPK